MATFSLKTKMSFAVSVLVIVLMSSFTIIFDMFFEAAFKRNIAGQQFSMVSEVASDIDEKVESAEALLAGVAGHITPFQARKPQSLQDILDAHTSLKLTFDDGASVLDRSGRVVASTEPGLRGSDWSERDSFQTPLKTGNRWISPPFFSESSDRPTMVIAQPLRSPQGEIFGVFVGGINILKDGFLGTFREMRVAKSGYFTLLSTDGTVIMHPDEKLLLRRVQKVDPLLGRALKGFEGSGETANGSGEEMLVSSRSLKTVPWVLNANYPVADAFQPIRYARWIWAGMTALGGTASVATIWFFMAYLTVPLTLLTSHIRKISLQEGMRPHVEVTSSDEIGELAKAFNLMLTCIGQKETELKKLSRAVEQNPSLVMITDTEGVIEYVNPKFVETTGYLCGELVGEKPSILRSVKTDPENYEALWRTIAGGEEWRGELCNRRKDGSTFWVSTVVTPIRNDEGATSHYLSLQEDVTSRKEAEWLTSTQVALSSIIADSPLGEVLPTMLRCLCKSAGWEAGCVWEVGQEETLTFVEMWISPSLRAAFSDSNSRAACRRGEGLPGRVWESGEAVWITETGEDDASPPFAADSGLRGRAALPIVAGGRVTGVVEFFSRSIREPDEAFLRVAPVLGSQLGQLMERKRADEELKVSEATYRAVFDASNDAIMVLDLDTAAVIDVNRRMCLLYGMTIDDARRTTLANLGECGSPDAEVMEYVSRARSGEPQVFEWLASDTWGERLWLELNLKRAVIGGKDRLLAVARDISERKQFETRLLGMALHDNLTGLPNRNLLHQRLTYALTAAVRNSRIVGVMFLDLDHFKQVNDTLGHAVGDMLLIKFAETLTGCVRQSDTVARLGGDEFIVMLAEVSHREGAAVVAGKILAALEEPFILEGNAVRVRTSIGISFFPLHGDSPEMLIRQADVAMYHAKQQGKNRFVFYEEEMAGELQR